MYFERLLRNWNYSKKAGLSDLHLGLESGSDPILDVMNKGVTSADMRKGFHMLDRAGIGYYVTVILGLGGRTFSRLHAIETAKFLNTIHPKDIWCLKLHLFPGTPLYRESKRGHFDPMTPEEILREEYLLLENLTVKDCLFEDTTDFKHLHAARKTSGTKRRTAARDGILISDGRHIEYSSINKESRKRDFPCNEKTCSLPGDKLGCSLSARKGAYHFLFKSSLILFSLLTFSFFRLVFLCTLCQ